MNTGISLLESIKAIRARSSSSLEVSLLHQTELDSYLNQHFASVTIRQPLFYNAPFGIRYELLGETSRAKSLFHAMNNPSDDLYIVLFADIWSQYSLDKAGLELMQVLHQYVSGFSPEQAAQSTIPYRYPDEDVEEGTVTLRIWTKKKAADLLADRLLSDKMSGDLGGDIYFINTRKHVLLDLYDDRGFDIVSTVKKPLVPMYAHFNSWILDNDRKKIDEMFQD